MCVLFRNSNTSTPLVRGLSLCQIGINEQCLFIWEYSSSSFFHTAPMPIVSLCIVYSRAANNNVLYQCVYVCVCLKCKCVANCECFDNLNADLFHTGHHLFRHSKKHQWVVAQYISIGAWPAWHRASQLQY